MSILSPTGIPEIVPIAYPERNGKSAPVSVPPWSLFGDTTIEYPDSDGKPMSDNTKQNKWIRLIVGNLEWLFRDQPNVFVAGDLLWYYTQHDPDKRLAPDVMLVFGRPKGDRGSYVQWKENDVPVTVAFEIRSPSNDEDEMAAKFYAYDDLGVEEYYVYDPDTNKLQIYHRGLQTFRQVHDIANYVSKRMGIRFEMTSPEMTIYLPTGERFKVLKESQAETRAERKRADAANRRADATTARMARLTELSRKARKGQASAEELTELERLEDNSHPA